MLKSLARFLRSILVTLAPHVLVATLAGATFGAAEALVGPPAAVGPRWLALALGVLLGAQLGVLLGGLMAVVAHLVGWLGRRVGLWAWLSSHTSTDPAAPRQPVVALHAAILAALVTSVGVLGVLVVAFDLILGATDHGAAPRLAAVAVVVGVGGLVFGLALARPLAGPVRWLDARVVLPRPHGAVGRYLCFVVVPVGLPLAAILARDAAILGAYTVGLWLAALVVGQGLAWVLLRRGLARASGKAVALGTLAVVIVVLSASLVLFHVQPSASDVVRKGIYTRLSVDTFRALTDVDRDGSSHLWGGGDCAPLDRARHPRAFDVPGNDVDENCDGVDAAVRSGQVEATPTFLGDLTVAGVEPRRYNIVWVIIDAARADHCSVHGYKTATTPYLEGLAKESLVFDGAYSQSSATVLSIPSMMTGSRPGALDWVKGRRLSVDERHTTLAERLKDAGYRTGLVIDKYIKDNAPGVMQGYDVVGDSWLDGERMPWYRRNAAVANALAIRMLERDLLSAKGEGPFLLTVYSADPHHPYDRHSEGFPKLGKSKKGLYDGEIAFADRYVGMLVDYLRYNQLWDDTIFIVTADHGEELGEHGGEQHATTCHEESTHVLLMVRVPGVEARRVDTHVALTDIAPTLLEVLGLDPGEMVLDGQSLLVPAFRPELVPPERPIFCTVLSQKAKQGDFFRQSVRIGDRALFHDRVSLTFSYYDTKADRGEQRDILQTSGEDEQIERMKELLEADLVSNLRNIRMTSSAPD